MLLSVRSLAWPYSGQMPVACNLQGYDNRDVPVDDAPHRRKPDNVGIDQQF